MVIQQAEIDLQKSKRDLSQLKEKYKLSITKSQAQISEILTSLKQQQQKHDRLAGLKKDFYHLGTERWNGHLCP